MPRWGSLAPPLMQGSFPPCPALGFPLTSARLFMNSWRGRGWVIRSLGNVHLCLGTEDTPSLDMGGLDFIIDFYYTGSLTNTIGSCGNRICYIIP